MQTNTVSEMAANQLWFKTGFTEIEFTYRVIHPLKAYSSVVFSMFSDVTT